MKNKRILSIAFLPLLILIICASAPETSRAGDKAVIQVLAGAGLKDALNERQQETKNFMYFLKTPVASAIFIKYRFTPLSGTK